LSSAEVVDSAGHLDRTLLYPWLDDGYEPPDPLHSDQDIRPDCVIEIISRLSLRFRDGRLDQPNETLNRSREAVIAVKMFDCRFDSPTVAVAEHKDQGDIQPSHCIFETADYCARLTKDVSRDPNHKEITHSEIEDQFGRNSRIGAAKN